MPTKPSYNEQELIYLIAEGNESAFAKLFEHHHQRVYSIALKISKSVSVSEELVQEVMLKIWQKRKDLPQVNNFEAYMYTVVQHAVYKSLKRIATNNQRISVPSPNLFAENPDPEFCLIEKEYHGLLQRGISALPSQQQQVYRLIREKGLKRSEVAELMQLQPDTVKFHLSRAVKSLWTYCKLHLHSIFNLPGTLLLVSSLCS